MGINLGCADTVCVHPGWYHEPVGAVPYPSYKDMLINNHCFNPDQKTARVRLPRGTPTACYSRHMNNSERFFDRANRLLDRLERILPGAPKPTKWNADAFVWRGSAAAGYLEPVRHPHRVTLADLLCMDRQKSELVRNTQLFLQGRPANHALLWGARGTGKSTLVKACFDAFVDRGLRLLEVEKERLCDLPYIAEMLHDRPERFLLYCDDLSFDGSDSSYTALKSVLDGSVRATPSNLLIYVTSNRRHLLPESREENQDVHLVEGEIHPGDAIEEKVSLSERFGLWLSFYPFRQDEYLAICDHWLQKTGHTGIGDDTTRLAALRWATQRGSRSGRVARQFAIDWAGRN